MQISSRRGQIWSFPVQKSVTSLKIAAAPPPSVAPTATAAGGGGGGADLVEIEIKLHKFGSAKNKATHPGHDATPYGCFRLNQQQEKLLFLRGKRNVVLLWLRKQLNTEYFPTPDVSIDVLLLGPNFLKGILYFIANLNVNFPFHYW